ncbi:MAG TPA: hypothetical protein PKV43_08215 [Armatimonadota bacterium]|nr:hypothetical protein [Armatimonadota bacterium]
MTVTKRNQISSSAVLWILISIIAGCVGFITTHKSSIKPLPISPENQPNSFYVVGFPKSGKPLLLKDERSKQIKEKQRYYQNRRTHMMMKNDDEPILWREDNRRNGPYSFYIAADTVYDTESALIIALNDKFDRVKIDIQDDNPQAKTQKVFLTHDSDDFSYYYVYSVSPDGVIPLEYGDFLRGDVFVALLKGGTYAMFALVLGFMLEIKLKMRRLHLQKDDN